MSQEINNTERQDLSLVVRAIGADLEQTQVRLITSVNADLLFHYWKVGHFILYLQEKKDGERKLYTSSLRRYDNSTQIRRVTLPAI